MHPCAVQLESSWCSSLNTHAVASDAPDYVVYCTLRATKAVCPCLCSYSECHRRTTRVTVCCTLIIAGSLQSAYLLALGPQLPVTQLRVAEWRRPKEFVTITCRCSFCNSTSADWSISNWSAAPTAEDLFAALDIPRKFNFRVAVVKIYWQKLAEGRPRKCFESGSALNGSWPVCLEAVNKLLGCLGRGCHGIFVCRGFFNAKIFFLLFWETHPHGLLNYSLSRSIEMLWKLVTMAARNETQQKSLLDLSIVHQLPLTSKEKEISTSSKSVIQ